MPTMSGADWRCEADYDYFDTLTPEQLAFEFLRRDDGYAGSYRQMVQFAGSGAQADADRLAANWGLRFRGGPAAPCRSVDPRLAAAPQPTIGAADGGAS